VLELTDARSTGEVALGEYGVVRIDLGSLLAG
jgi:hypothetical protein